MSGQAVVIGASGGIGRALVRCLVESGRFDRVHALARWRIENKGARAGHIDLDDEESIARAASLIGPEIECLIVASGLLHGPGMKPERSLGDLDAKQLARIFATNTIGPALVLKHFAPMTAKDRRATIALLSARVGSISDNRLGGWYGYRASKTALNMIVKCARSNSRDRDRRPSASPFIRGRWTPSSASHFSAAYRRTSCSRPLIPQNV